MARKTSRRSDETPTPETELETTQDASGTDVPDTVEAERTTAVDAPEQSPEPIEMDTSQDDTAPTSGEGASQVDAQPDGVPGPDAPGSETPPTLSPPERIVEQRGPGAVSLVAGGIVAAAIGFGAAYLGYLPSVTKDNTAAVTTLTANLEEQDAQLENLGDRATELEAQIAALPEPEAPVEVDLSSLQSQIDEMSATLQDLSDRMTALENRPVLSGDGSEDAAAITDAMVQLQDTIAQQESANAALVDDIAALATEAEERITAAENRAEARVTAATAQAALSQLRIAVAAGNPFADPLQEVAQGSGAEIPETLVATAEAGVPTLEELQATFPAAARAALPVALRETAGDGTMDRLGAFVRGQVGGRSLEPRAGDDPDAVLSRAEAAVAAGDLAQALDEVQALPEPARDEFAIWIGDARARLTATEALDDLARTLDSTN